MSEEKFDAFLSRALKSCDIRDLCEICEIEFDTPMGDVKQKIIEQIKKRRAERKRRQRLIIQAAVLMIAFLAVSSYMLFPQSAYAFREKVVQLIMNISNNIQFQFSGSTPRPPNKLEADIAETQSAVSFKIAVPRYVPPGFEYQGIAQIPGSQEPRITMTFAAQDSLITVNQAIATDNRSLTINIDADRGKVEEVQFGRYSGFLITYFDGKCELIWLSDDNIEYAIFGDLEPAQALEMATLMQ